MNIHNDFQEFLQLLKEAEVEFVVVGGYAVAFYGYVRATNDLDIFFRNSEDNIRKISFVLQDFGISSDLIDVKAFSEPGSIIRMGVPPVRIEMINNISGLTFDDVWLHRQPGFYGDAEIAFISFEDLIKNKKASGRPKDLADVDELGA
jgi:predicted nucleotidyltransferase